MYTHSNEELYRMNFTPERNNLSSYALFVQYSGTEIKRRYESKGGGGGGGGGEGCGRPGEQVPPKI